jgi:preprotein translocase subunit SecD
MSTHTMESSSGSVAPSQRANLQMRQVLDIVMQTSADWRTTRLTCSGQGDALNDCVASALDAVRIILLRPEESKKYVLGPVIVDATDVERATAQLEQLEQQPDFWSISIELKAEAAEAFKATTQVAARSPGPQNEIAIILDGRIVSSPVVVAPIPSGKLIITGGFTETEAKTLAVGLIGAG